MDSFNNYKLQNHGGKGLLTGFKSNKITGISPDVEDVFCVINDGRLIRVKTENLSVKKRRSKGVKFVNLDSGKIIYCM